METEALILLVEHRLHNAEVVSHHVIMNPYVSCVCIEADWYPCNTYQRTLEQSPGPESPFPSA